jgi:hypothetical protein
MFVMPTMSSFKIYKYIGSNIVMICFLSSCCTVLNVQKVMTASSQECLTELTCATVPWYKTNGAHPGDDGCVHR